MCLYGTRGEVHGQAVLLAAKVQELRSVFPNFAILCSP